MKAVVVRESGPPDVLRYEDIADPVPQADEALVRIKRRRQLPRYLLPRRISIGVDTTGGGFPIRRALRVPACSRDRRRRDRGFSRRPRRVRSFEWLWR